MKVLVLNGSPRSNGNTIEMVAAFRKGAEHAGHDVEVVEVYEILKDTEMLVLASPIYYHGISGQLKCVIDRFYSAAYPISPPKL